MTTIEMSNIGDYVVNGHVDVPCWFKADKDSDESTRKHVTLRQHFRGVNLRDVVHCATTPKKISWQNGPGRSRFDTWTNRQVVEIDFTAPGARLKTPEEQQAEYLALFASSTPEDQAKMIEQLQAASQAINAIAKINVELE